MKTEPGVVIDLFGQDVLYPIVQRDLPLMHDKQRLAPGPFQAWHNRFLEVGASVSRHDLSNGTIKPFEVCVSLTDLGEGRFDVGARQLVPHATIRARVGQPVSLIVEYVDGGRGRHRLLQPMCPFESLRIVNDCGV